MQFPNATPADWTDAHAIVKRAALRAGFDDQAAADMAQNAMLALVKRKEDGRFTGPRHFAFSVVRFCRRQGWNMIRDRRASRPLDSLRAVSRRGGMPMDPAWLAERAETLTRTDRQKAERRHGCRVLDVIHAAAGVGPMAMHEQGTTPAIHGTGYVDPPRTRGIPATEGDGSAIRTAPRTDPQPLTGEALVIYRERLAEYYATR
jgi:hypothetical protein